VATATAATAAARGFLSNLSAALADCTLRKGTRFSSLEESEDGLSPIFLSFFLSNTAGADLFRILSCTIP
jgi:hypothetical protein